MSASLSCGRFSTRDARRTSMQRTAAVYFSCSPTGTFSSVSASRSTWTSFGRAAGRSRSCRAASRRSSLRCFLRTQAGVASRLCQMNHHAAAPPAASTITLNAVWRRCRLCVSRRRFKAYRVSWTTAPAWISRRSFMAGRYSLQGKRNERLGDPPGLERRPGPQPAQGDGGVIEALQANESRSRNVRVLQWNEAVVRCAVGLGDVAARLLEEEAGVRRDRRQRHRRDRADRWISGKELPPLGVAHFEIGAPRPPQAPADPP